MKSCLRSHRLCQRPQVPWNRQRAVTFAVATALLVACSPALNWREVALDRLVVLLPCKPDRAQRTVPLAGAELPMEMAGCEADGALFAASHIRAATPEQVPAVLEAWRAASFANMRADKPVQMPSASPAGGVNPQQWSARGQRASGEPVQARLEWWVSGPDIFHVAVYAEKLRDDHTDTLFNQAKIQ